MTTRTKILVRGIVQGVGFRPFVYSLAKKRDLRGSVLNNETGVLIDVEGYGDEIDAFIAELKQNPPPLSSIESVARQDYKSNVAFLDFHILSSKSNGHKFLPISADISTCHACIAELFDSGNRRYKYPFINCTNCGPRFTIIEDVPYDRERTTMREFEMCDTCRSEYEDPMNRRFHAEPICCPECGPQLSLFDSEPASQRRSDAGSNAILIERSRDLLLNGKILAIKSLGGYHLACDAMSADAVGSLRNRKIREDKPFALMAGSLECIEQYCEVSDDEKALLISRERPIVLLVRKKRSQIPDAVAPGVSTLGFMLPYTPVQYLLFEKLKTPLVMTSGNISDEPVCYNDIDAANRLANIADYFLTNNRRIHIRTDDSIVRVAKFDLGDAGNIEPQTNTDRHRLNHVRTQIVRRSRGHSPAPIKTSFKCEKQILACGAELKNTFCITRGGSAFVSHHIGDLENLETLTSFTDGIEHYKNLFDLSPKVIAYDLHPEYLSTKYALEQDTDKVGVQHHHAHIASCMADNKTECEVIGVAMDGLGFGSDGKLWGGEFLVADFAQAERIAHLDYVPMPGGAKAIREPWRMAAVYLQRAFGDEFTKRDLPFNKNLDDADWRTIKSMISADTNCPETSSMGRLFDAVSALLCLRSTVNYEGQAAIALETIADKNASESYCFDVDGGGIIKGEPAIRRAVEDILSGVSAAEISARFHLGVADLIAKVAIDARDKYKLNRVALSGGVFQNMFLLERTCRQLDESGFEVLTHSRVPTNDGGISLGQAAVANAQICLGRI